MQKNSITNKITPCCGLPFSVIYWWVSNLTLKSESDRQFIISKISQGGMISIDGWKVLINSGTLEADASLTKAEFLAWFDCGRQPSCEQLKLIIEGYKMGSWVGDLNEISFVNVLGVLKVTDTAPTVQGLYILSEVGTYANLGGLVATANKLNYAYFDGTTWSLIAVDVPNTNYNSGKLSPTSTDKAETGVSVSNYIFKNSGNLLNINDIIEGKYLASGQLNDNAAFNVTNFIYTEADKMFVRNFRSVECYNINKEFISQIMVGILPSVVDLPNETKFIRLDYQSGNEIGAIISESDIVVTSAEFQEKSIKNEFNPVWKKIIHEDTSYNSIRTLAERCFEVANYHNRFEIVLAEGTYTETDWKGWGDFVKIVGWNRDNCIVQFDGNSNNVLPSDYSFSSERGKVANIAPQPTKHIVFASRNLNIENITISAKNCKYPIHADNPGFTNIYFKNCVIEEKIDCNYPVGIGIWSGQNITFEKCKFKRVHYHTKRHAGIYHNTFNQEKGSECNFIDCEFIQCGGFLVNENGSNQNDVLNIINCHSDSVFEIEYGVSQDADGKTFWTNHITGVKVKDPRNIPYNIKLNTAGTKVDLIEDSVNFVGYESSRPKWYEHVISDYFGKAKVSSGVVNKGELISSKGDSSHNTAPRVKPYESAILDLKPIGVALNDAVTDEWVYYAKIDRFTKVKCSGGISDYNRNTRKLIFNEVSKVFESSPTASWKDCDAFAYENNVEGGLLLVKLNY